MTTYSATDDQAYDKLQAFLTQVDADATALDPSRPALTRVIRDSQNAPRVLGPYAMIQLVNVEDVSEVDCRKWQGATVSGVPRVIETVSRSVHWQFGVHLYGHGATEYARLFSHALLSDVAEIPLFPMTVMAVEPVKRAPELVQDQWEGRCMFQVVLGGLMDERLLADVIDSGNVTLTGKGGHDVIKTLHFQRT